MQYGESYMMIIILLRDFEFPSTMIKIRMLFKSVLVFPELFAICNCHITGNCYNPTYNCYINSVLT